jgi:hypothetical protein
MARTCLVRLQAIHFALTGNRALDAAAVRRVSSSLVRSLSRGDRERARAFVRTRACVKFAAFVSRSARGLIVLSSGSCHEGLRRRAAGDETTPGAREPLAGADDIRTDAAAETIEDRALDDAAEAAVQLLVGSFSGSHFEMTAAETLVGDLIAFRLRDNGAVGGQSQQQRQSKA